MSVRPIGQFGDSYSNIYTPANALRVPYASVPSVLGCPIRDAEIALTADRAPGIDFSGSISLRSGSRGNRYLTRSNWHGNDAYNNVFIVTPDSPSMSPPI
jgi:hypothetical protein